MQNDPELIAGPLVKDQEPDALAEAMFAAQNGVANAVSNGEDELRVFLTLRDPDAAMLQQTRDAVRDILIELDRWKDAAETYLAHVAKQER